jgi:hypothetical protein
LCYFLIKSLFNSVFAPNSRPDGAKFRTANGFLKTSGYSLGNGKEFTLENFAKLLKQKIPPRTDSNGIKVPQPYEQYLKTLRSHVITQKAISEVRNALEGLERMTLAKSLPGKEALEPIKKLLENIKPEQLTEFESERELASNSIAKTNWWFTMSDRVPSYFQDFRETDYTQFIAARSIQLSEKAPKELENAIFSTVEEVIHALPKNLDLTKELYRYSLIQDFERALEDMKIPVQRFIGETTNEQFAKFLQEDSKIRPHLESYINKLGEKEFERFFKDNPSLIYQKVTQTVQDPDKIPYALKNYKNSLNKEDWEVLQNVKNRGTFRKQMNIIRQKTVGSEDPNKENYLETLNNLEKDAINKNSINYPYIEDLFHRGMIDEVTYNKLNPVDGMVKSKFMENLGTQEDFSKILMENFKNKLLKITTDPALKNEKVVEEAKDIASKSYLKKLDNDAKKIYLTKEAFMEKDSMHFDQAIQVYDEGMIKKYLLNMDNDFFAEAYVEAHLSPVDQPKLELKKFLDEVGVKRFQQFGM